MISSSGTFRKLAVMRDKEYRDVRTLAALAHGLRPHLSALPPSMSQLASTRRALARLARGEGRNCR
jgi:hypothetical protein